jgi:hypothetical protein
MRVPENARAMSVSNSKVVETSGQDGAK